MELNEEDDGKKSSIALKLWVEDPKKLKGKYKDTGAIEFTFDLVSEVPEVVAQEMVNMSSCRVYSFLCPCLFGLGLCWCWPDLCPTTWLHLST